MNKNIKTKLTAIDEKDNHEISNIVDAHVEEVVTNVLQVKGGKNQDKYFLYRILGIPPRIAASLCNYNEDYGYKLDKKYRSDLNLRARIEQITGQIPEQYRSLCKLRLLDVAEIEGKALAEYKKYPQKAIDKPQLLKQVKQTAGVLVEDDMPNPPMVDIKAVRNLMIQVHEQGYIKETK